MKITVSPAVKKAIKFLFICLTSIYLTFLVDIYTLNTTLKKVFVFGYFVVMCTLFMYLKNRLLKVTSKKTISPLYTAVILVFSISVLAVFQDTFLPLVRSNVVTLRAEGNGEVWLVEAEADGKSIPLSQLSTEEKYNWEYNADYDDYVYYPGEETEDNGLSIEIAGQDIKLKFGANSWSGSVLVTNSEGNTEVLELYSEEQGTREYLDSGVRQYTALEWILFNLGALILIIFIFDAIAVLLHRNQKKSTLHKKTRILNRVKKWKWYHWVTFLLLDAIITFQFTAQFLFMDIWQTQVESWQIIAYLVAALAGAACLLVSFFCIDTMEKKITENKEGKTHIERRRRSVSRWTLCIILCIFLSLSAVAYKILPDVVAASYTSSEITLTILSDRNVNSNGHEMLLAKSAIINGAAVELNPVFIGGSWDTDGGYFWGLTPGSTITFSLPAAEDIDLRFNKHAWSGIVEIIDGEHREKLDLYSDTVKDYQASYRVKSNTIPGLSKVEVVLIAVSIGAVFAGITYLLIYTTLNSTSIGLYRFAIFLFMSSIWLIYLCAGNPGGISIDTLNQFAQAKGIIGITDAHPALLTMFYRWIFSFTDHPVVFSMMQIVSFALVAAVFLSYFSSRNISRKLLSVFCILFSTHIVNGIYASTLWKDIPYTICLLWLTFLLTKLAVERKTFFSMRNIIQLIICMPLTVLLRHNGVIVFTITGILLVGVTIAYHSWKPILTLMLGLLVFIGIKGPIYTSFGVEPSSFYVPSGLLHGMVYVSLSTEENIPIIDELTSRESWRAIYEPYSANSFALSEIAVRENLSKKISNYDSKRINHEYIKTFFRHPCLIIKDRLFGCNLLWNSIPSGYNWRVANDQYDIVVENNDFGYYCKENALTDAVNYFYHQSVNPCWSDMFIWRAGPYISLALILLFLSIEHKKYTFIFPLLPLLGNSMSLVLAMSWQDYRYVYFAMVCSCFLAIAYFARLDEEI